MTRRTTLLTTSAVVLLAAGALLWSRGNDGERLAEAQRALATLRYEGARSAAATTDAARYWSGDYASIDAAGDPLLAANAAYRAAVEPGGSAKVMVTRLDEVVQRYADVMRNDPSSEDAAFNYEFVVRYRAAIAARGVAVPPVDADVVLTPHGRVGAPARGTSQQQFKVLVPMRPDERREAEEAGKAGRRVRKG